MIEVTDDTFEVEVINSDTPVIVDFSAGWCNPCKMMAPVLEQLSKETEGKVKIVKVDVDSTRVAEKYVVRAVPTLMLFIGGEPLDTLVGAHTRSKIAAWLMSHTPVVI